MLSDITLTLQVSPDIGDGIVRLDPADMKQLGILPRDFVALVGVRTSYVRVLPAFMEDRNQRLAMVGSLVSLNIGVQSGHQVQVVAVRERPAIAESVTLKVEDDLDLLYMSVRTEQFGNFWHERAVVAGDWLRVPSLDRNVLLAQVVTTVPEGVKQIGSVTRFDITAHQTNDKIPRLGGVRDIYRTCQKLVHARLKAALNQAARTVLLTGQAGCGKALLIKRVCEELKVSMIVLDAHTLLNKHLSRDTSDTIVSLSDMARRGPTLVVLDHMEVLTCHDCMPDRLAVAAHMIIGRLCALLDEVVIQPNIMIFGILSGMIDPRFKEHQRFDVILPVDAPNRLERQEILTLAARDIPLAENVNLERLAAVTFGATGRELHQLVMTASRLAQGNKITNNDFNAAMRHIEYSVANEVHCDIPSVMWNDVAGLDDIKQLLRETLSWSFSHREHFEVAGVAPPRSILLSGGQGTGKTSLVRALSNVIPLNFIEVECPLLASFDLPSAIRAVHDSFILARRKSPCLLFFDDIDILFDMPTTPEGDGEVSAIVPHLLIELDRLALMPGVVVAAATNRPDRLSAEVLRPGRFDYAVTLPMPDAAARKKILQIHARKLPLAADVDFEHLANITQGFSPAEIANLCNRVGLMALRQSLNEEHGSVVPPVANATLFEQVMRGKKG